MTDTPKTPDETPKQETAKKVVSAKRRYFIPKHGVNVKAATPLEAGEVFNKQLTNKEGK